MTLREIREFKFDTLESLDFIEDEKEREEAIAEINKSINTLICNKSNNLIAVAKEYDSRIDALDNEIKRLKAYKDTMTKAKERFTEFVDYNLAQLDVREVTTDYGRISYRKCPLSIEVPKDKLDKLPADVIRQKVSYEPDKEAIKDLYVNKGIKLDGVIYNENKYKIKFE